MALPFIAGLALGALGVIAYKNRDTLKQKSENIFKEAKQKGEILKKDIETKISKTKERFEKKEVVEKPKTTKRTYTKKAKAEDGVSK
ncbi:hypothetical protein CRU87_00380 [Aliarcobacter trophiarum LMG 25534]|uniref:YtxH domain-containing protein n=1 Tax=Aliarcobacter trophiarum LMG 25534 TaxID=1032241 RepID=A0AAD0VLJ9_9BACT|nr:hypothetical protein [Aliarcobacter trophiarum]AXK48348.1 hypothetical protein ATR_0467 [Aliarcobacter trophiarum LMG 25534]RXI28623.1 hypothetical protein CRU89_01325 [Aliarcobacter trophiarum]RXJ92978.1 hypothetical protein CRU87_00380 [Aliarcobacter trophiarum LMG 25534]